MFQNKILNIIKNYLWIIKNIIYFKSKIIFFIQINNKILYILIY